MQCLTKTANPVTLQILRDTLDEKGIEYRVDDAGMRALLPLPGITDARVMVHGADMEAAEQVLHISILGMHMIEGALNLISGMRLLLAEKTLRTVLWRILALLFVLMLMLTGGVYWLAEYLAALWLPSGDAWYWQILSWLVWLLSIILALLFGVVSFTALGSVAAAPWLDELAMRTEALTGRNIDVHPASWWQQIVHSLVNSIRPLFGLLIWGCVALVLFFIPLIGQVAATVVWGYASIRFLNYELMDPVASRKGWNFKRRKQALGQHNFFYLGFGGTALGLMLVPVVNLFVLPAAVVGLSRKTA